MNTARKLSVGKKSVKIYDLNYIVSREPLRKRVNLSKLPPEQKRMAWDKLKATRPEVAELLKRPDVAEILKTFNAQILIPSDEGT